MASIRYRKRGSKGSWSYEIRDKGQTLAHGSHFKTKKEAIIEAEEIAQKIRLGGRLSKDMTLVSLFQEWLELKIFPSNRSDSTKRKYVSRKKVIVELFGEQKISLIRGSDYQKAMNVYGGRVGRDTLRKLHNNIRSAVKMALMDKIMIDDFTENVELHPSVKEQNSEDKYLHSEEDYFTVLEELRKRFDYFKSLVPFILYFLFVTGLRFGELMGLVKADVDIERCGVYTYRRYNTVLHEFVPPKNKTSVRFVPMKKKDIDLVLELIHLQEKVNKELELDNSEGLIFQHFSYKYGLPLTDTVNKYLKEMLESLEIYPLITTKGARHTYGSYLWHCGIDLGVIAKVLGHKDISMLVEVYGHTLEEKIDEEFGRIRLLK